MMYRTLKQTDLNVSRLCFGTMTFGNQANQEAASSMVDCCSNAGINFFDTANMYQTGVSEEMLGRALKGKRQQVVLASKVGMQVGEEPDQQGLSKQAIRRGIEESLRRLQTDYLDIYYLHKPDYATPLEETLEAIEALVSAGKVRYPACSNYSSWQVTRMLWLAEKNGYQPIIITQPMYNLVARGIEQEFLPMAKEFGVSTVVYNPLAGGFLTGKHRDQEITPGTRFDDNKLYQDRYWHRENFDAVAQLQPIAEAAGRTLISLALNWLLHHTQIDCIILGASRLEQLQQNLAACEEGPLPVEIVRACDQVWGKLRGSVPVYNR